MSQAVQAYSRRLGLFHYTMAGGVLALMGTAYQVSCLRRCTVCASSQQNKTKRRKGGKDSQQSGGDDAGEDEASRKAYERSRIDWAHHAGVADTACHGAIDEQRPRASAGAGVATLWIHGNAHGTVWRAGVHARVGIGVWLSERMGSAILCHQPCARHGGTKG